MTTPQNTNPPSSPWLISPPSPPMIGFEFRPNPTEIFCYLFPSKLAQRTLPSVIKNLDLYAPTSLPEAIFQTVDDDATDFYFFTTLKPKTLFSNQQFSRLSGNGVWKGENPTTCDVEIEGKIMEMGTKRVFKYEYNDKDEERKYQEMGVSWIMHEYSIHKDFVNYYLIKRDNIDVTCHRDFKNMGKLRKTVFCHVEKRVVDTIPNHVDDTSLESTNTRNMDLNAADSSLTSSNNEENDVHQINHEEQSLESKKCHRTIEGDDL